MKKRISLLVTLSILCLSITGCSIELPFGLGKKGEEESQDVAAADDVQGVTGVAVLTGLMFNVGDTATVDDFVIYSDEMQDKVVMAAIIDDMGMVVESVTFDEPGQYYYEVAIDFDDGSSFGDVVTVNVTDGTDSSDTETETTNSPTQSVELPANILMSVQSDGWGSVFAPTINMEDDSLALVDSPFIVSSNENVVTFVDPVTIFPRADAEANILQSNYNYASEVGFIDNGLMEHLTSLNASIFDEDIPSRFALEMSKGIMHMFSDGFTDDEEIAESLERFDTYIEYFEQLIKDITVVKTESSDSVLYDTEGNVYPIKILEYAMDLSKLGATGDSSIVRASYFYVSMNNGVLVFSIPTQVSNTVEASDLTVGDGDDDEVDAETLPDFESYEDFLAYMSEHISDVEDVSENNLTYAYGAIADMANNILIGDYSVLRNDSTPEPDSPSVNEEGSVSIEVPGSGDDAQLELTGANGKKIQPYDKRYPYLWTWWAAVEAQREYIYRRWVYSGMDGQDAAVTYVGSITPKNGNGVTEFGNGQVEYVDPLGNEEEPTSSGGNNGSNTGSSSNSDAPDLGNKFTLSSSYRDYEISDGLVNGVTFNTAASTSGRLALVYNGSRYYMETARATQINNYSSESLYSTNSFQDAEFSVVESDISEDTDIGRIIIYVIKYIDMQGNEMEVPYMAVYSIDSDYIVIYADNLPNESAAEIFIELLRDMVKIKE